METSATLTMDTNSKTGIENSFKEFLDRCGLFWVDSNSDMGIVCGFSRENGLNMTNTELIKLSVDFSGLILQKRSNRDADGFPLGKIWG